MLVKKIVYTRHSSKFFLVDRLIVGNSGRPVIEPIETNTKLKNKQIMYTLTKVPNIIMNCLFRFTN